MNPGDYLHCPRCKGRIAPVLSASVAATLCCAECGWVIPIVDGIADFVGDPALPPTDPHRYDGDPRCDDTASADLLGRICAAAGDRWPVGLGDVLEFGCGSGQMTRILALALNGAVRRMVVTDTAMDRVQACRERLVTTVPSVDEAAVFATLSFHQDTVRDAVADTVVGATVLPRIGNVRAFLAMVHRVLKPGGRAMFVVPNRRYHQALSQVLAAALVRQFARHGVWPEQHHALLQVLAHTRQRLIHRDDAPFLSNLQDKHFFDSEALEDVALELGFATADTFPLDPDALGIGAVRRLCEEVGLPDALTAEMVPLAVSLGAPYFQLLAPRDQSASMLVWLTKGIGPSLRTFSPRPKPPAVEFARPDLALGGAPPRWSLELVAHDTQDGITVALGGWCLVNTDVSWVRLRLDGITRLAPVWRPRPDVYEALNSHGLYQPLNALCCGLQADLLFDGLHPVDNHCHLHLAIVLANGLIMEGPAPERLVMDKAFTIVQ